MKFQAINVPDLQDFFAIVSPELNLSFSDEGRKLTLHQENGVLKIVSTKNEVTISYQEKAHLFRALTIVSGKEETDYTYEETPQFKEIGPMADFSRNAIMSVEGVKRFILLNAKMGLNVFMLYLEDTYEIPEYPYFGYNRGCYTQKEMKEIDAYGETLGVEVIPSIQTLGHLKNPLKWAFADGMRDTEDILLVGEEKTYEFIEAAVRSVRSSFHTKKIHIGMDEAHSLGRGRYLDQHGYQDRFKIMETHLNRVNEICEKYDFDPMMWSDMFFRIGSKTGDYYDLEAEIPASVGENMPKIDMVYWDYYNKDAETYSKLMAIHQQLKQKLIFAGGVWTWNGMAPNYGKAFLTTQAGLQAAKDNHIEEVYATMWGDDGGETPFISSLLGLQLFAEHQFHKTVTIEEVKAQFSLMHHLDPEDFLTLNEFDATPGVPKENLDASNASKLLLYQDVLYGQYETTLHAYPLKAHYQKLAEKLAEIKGNDDTKSMFAFYHQLAKTLSLKADLGDKIYQDYQAENHDGIKEDLHLLSELKEEVNHTSELYRVLWYQWNKAFGYEVIDLRFGALMKRIETAIWRLTAYENKEIVTIDELETPRLPYERAGYFSEEMVGFNMFDKIYTASKISGV